ncbi:ABC transporter substrate-binding protein [Alphaproteobacteria bacterium]|nr:ABC transporter substrate-binding protein [Alphaproteobacteria bacterium]
MKIVSLLPAASEILVDLGLLDQIVAVSHECNYPKNLKTKFQITSSNIPDDLEQSAIDLIVTNAIKNHIPLYNINTDKLRDINPDIIVTQGLCDVCSISENQIEATLKNKRCTLSSKTKIISLNGTSFNEICSDILKLGKLINKEEIAKDLVSNARKTKIQISTMNTNKSILLLEWIDPYFSAGHWIPEQIEMAGFKSAIGKKGEKSKIITIEEIIKSDPDYIGLICCGYNLNENKSFANQVYNDKRINHLTAIKNQQIFAFDSDSYFSRPSLRILEGAMQLKNAITNNDNRFHCKRY